MSHNRRSFLRGLLGGAAAVALAPFVKTEPAAAALALHPSAPPVPPEPKADTLGQADIAPGSYYEHNGNLYAYVCYRGVDEAQPGQMVGWTGPNTVAPYGRRWGKSRTISLPRRYGKSRSPAWFTLPERRRR